VSEVENKEVVYEVIYFDRDFRKKRNTEETVMVNSYLSACYDYLTCIFGKSAVDEVYSNLVIYLIECDGLTDKQIMDNKDRINDMLSRIDYISDYDVEGYHSGTFKGVRSDWIFSASGDGDFVYGLADIVSNPKGTGNNLEPNSYDVNNYNIFLGVNNGGAISLAKVLYHEISHLFLSSYMGVFDEGLADRLAYLMNYSINNYINTDVHVMEAGLRGGNLCYSKTFNNDMFYYLNSVEANFRVIVGENLIHSIYKHAYLGDSYDKECAMDLFDNLSFSEELVDSIESINMFYNGIEEKTPEKIAEMIEKINMLLGEYVEVLNDISQISGNEQKVEVENSIKKLNHRIALLEAGTPIAEFYRLARITNSCLKIQVDTIDSDNKSAIIAMMMRLESLRKNGLILTSDSDNNPEFDKIYSSFVDSYIDATVLDGSGILDFLEVEQYRIGRINDVFFKCEEVTEVGKRYGVYVDAKIPSYYSLTNNGGVVEFRRSEPEDMSIYIDLGYRSVIKNEKSIGTMESSGSLDDTLKCLVKC